MNIGRKSLSGIGKSVIGGQSRELAPKLIFVARFSESNLWTVRAEEDHSLTTHQTKYKFQLEKRMLTDKLEHGQFPMVSDSTKRKQY